MWKNLETSYFLKRVFSFLDEGLKLKIIKYNKSLQKIIDKSLINYKMFSERFIIYEDGKRKGKEYLTINDQLIYEGEYLNGIKNGKGKEYDIITGKLIFDGEYLNGIKNGKGKGYDASGKFIYEGEYLNGKRNGEGKEYYNDRIMFKGKYMNDRK